MARSSCRNGLYAAMIGALALTGCSGSGSGDSSSSAGAQSAGSETQSSQEAARTATPSETSAADPSTAPSGGRDADLAKTSFPVGMKTALRTARKTAGARTVTKIELDHSKAAGNWVWKVDVQKGTDQHEITIDTRSGKVVAQEHDHESDHPRAVTPEKLTPQDALSTATKRVAGSVSEWSLEYDDGIQGYKVEIRTSGEETTDVVVRVDTGKVTEVD